MQIQVYRIIFNDSLENSISVINNSHNCVSDKDF